MHADRILDYNAMSKCEWEQACCDSFVPLSVGHVADEFQGSLRTAFLPEGVHIARGISGGSTILRGDRLIRREPRDNVLLSYYQAGTGSVQQFGRRADLTSDSGAFYYSEKPYILSLDPMQQIVIQVDRKSLQISDHEISSLTARRVDDKFRPSLRILARIAEELFADSDAQIGTGEYDSISHAVLVLLRGLSDSILSSAPGHAYRKFAESRVLTRQAALSFIDRNFTDPELSPARVAESLHISRRHLYDVLDDVKITPLSYIREKRLARASELLARGCLVEAAMRKSGFASTSTFRRAFRNRFGCAPTEYVVRH